MVNAKVNGVECVVYDYYDTEAGVVCLVKYPNYNNKLLVLAELIEVSYE